MSIGKKFLSDVEAFLALVEKIAAKINGQPAKAPSDPDVEALYNVIPPVLDGVAAAQKAVGIEAASEAKKETYESFEDAVEGALQRKRPTETERSLKDLRVWLTDFERTFEVLFDRWEISRTLETFKANMVCDIPGKDPLTVWRAATAPARDRESALPNDDGSPYVVNDLQRVRAALRELAPRLAGLSGAGAKLSGKPSQEYLERVFKLEEFQGKFLRLKGRSDRHARRLIAKGDVEGVKPARPGKGFWLRRDIAKALHLA